jgi:hypothetical protein
MVQILYERESFQVYFLVAGVVDFYPGRVVSILVEPGEIERGNLVQVYLDFFSDVDRFCRNGNYYVRFGGRGGVGASKEACSETCSQNRGNAYTIKF